MKKILSMTVVLVLGLCILPLPMPQVNAQPPDWIPSYWVQLTTNPHYDAQPSWSPDANVIVYTAQSQAGPPSKMWVMNANGTNKRVLRDLWIEAADFSSDGSRIVFSRYAGGNSFHIAVTDFDEGNIYDYTDIYSTGSSHTPQWSPMGDKIAFHNDAGWGGSPSNIFTVDPSGGGLTQLTTEGDCYFPSWSPDGSKIAYQKGYTIAAEIYSMYADGTNKVQLTNMPGEARAGRPMWSPDGKISFLSDFEGQVDIYQMNEDGTNIVQLTNTPGMWGESGEEYDHAWSPDGKWIALSEHIEADNSDIYLVPPCVSRQLTTDLNTDRYPAVLRDNTGKIWVFFDSYRLGGNPWAIWYKASTDNGESWSEPLLLTSCPGVEFYVISAIQDSTGKFWLVFSASKTPAGGDNELWFMTSDDGGNTWSEPQKPYEGTAPWPGYGAPTIVEAFDKIWIFFMTGEGLKYVSSDDGGLMWSSPASLPADIDSLRPHSIRDVDGNIWLFFERQLAYGTGMELTRNITCMKSTDGVTWSQQLNIEEMGPGPECYPWAVQDYSGKIIVFFDAYRDYATGYDRTIHYVESNDDGVTWSDPEAFTLNPTTDWDATTVLTYEGLLVFWVSDRSGNWDIWYRLWPRTPPVEDTENYIEYVNGTAQDLPDEIFNATAEDIPDVKNDFSDLFNDTLENVNEGNYEAAIEKLNSIKEEIYEEMVESDERQETISMINDLIEYLESLL